MKNKMLDYIIVILQLMCCLGVINLIIAISNIFLHSLILTVITLTSNVWIFAILISINLTERHNDKVILKLYKSCKK